MNLNTKAGLVGLLLALSTMVAHSSTASENQPSEHHLADNSQTIDGRLSRLSSVIRQREGNMSLSDVKQLQRLHAAWFNNPWNNNWNNRPWNNWNNNWRDGGSFFNNRGGGGFANIPGGGGFANGGGGGFLNR